jgi:hypothetical protein
MALSRVIGGWILLTVWLLACEAAGRLLGRKTGPWIRPPLWLYAAQALLLTLLAALWFGSLGSGEWWLVFGLLGGLMESYPRAEQRPGKVRPGWRPALGWIARVSRIVAAGGLLAWRLGPA